MSNSINNRGERNAIAISFDVEDWFTVRNMRSLISESEWDRQELRINVGMDFILATLAEKNIKATFFILGWIADRCPELVYKLSALGHEIGCHGYFHTPIDLMDRHSFEMDLRKAIRSIEATTGKRPKGFRAPSFSITKKTAWAIPIIKSCGLQYDSSIFAIAHPDYGIADFPRTLTLANEFLEVPLRKSSLGGVHIPVCGGGYFRMLPYSLIRSALRQDLKSGPVVMYFHPWEFDPSQPRVKLPRTKAFRHYVGLNSNRKKFIQLINDFEFITLDQLIASSLAEGSLANYHFDLDSCKEEQLLVNVPAGH